MTISDEPDLQNRLDQHGDAINTIHDRLDHFGKLLATHGTHLSDYISITKQYQNQTKSLTNRILDLVNRIKALENQTDKLDDLLNPEASTLASDEPDVQSRLNQHAEAFETIDQQLDKLTEIAKKHTEYFPHLLRTINTQTETLNNTYHRQHRLIQYINKLHPDHLCPVPAPSSHPTDPHTSTGNNLRPEPDPTSYPSRS